MGRGIRRVMAGDAGPPRRVLPGDVHALPGLAALAVAAGSAVRAAGLGVPMAVGAGANVERRQDLLEAEHAVAEPHVAQRLRRNARRKAEVVALQVALAKPREVDVVHQLLIVDDDSRRGVRGHLAGLLRAVLLAGFPAGGIARAIGVDGAADAECGKVGPAVLCALRVASAARLAVLSLAPMERQVREARF